MRGISKLLNEGGLKKQALKVPNGTVSGLSAINNL